MCGAILKVVVLTVIRYKKLFDIDCYLVALFKFT